MTEETKVLQTNTEDQLAAELKAQEEKAAKAAADAEAKKAKAEAAAKEKAAKAAKLSPEEQARKDLNLPANARISITDTGGISVSYA